MRWSPELRAILHGLCRIARMAEPPCPLPSAWGWNRWAAMVEDGQLAPLFGGRMGELPYQLPDDVRHDLAVSHLRAGQEAAARAGVCAGVLGRIREVADPVLLKGGALASILYRSAAERTMWDIDLLFESDRELDAVDRILWAEGFVRGRALPGHHHEAPLVHRALGAAFELHRNLATPHLSKSGLAAMTARTRRIGFMGAADIRIFDEPATLVHLAIHALRDPESAPLVRNLFEIAWLSFRLGDRLGEAMDLAARAGAAAALKRPLGMASRLFGTPTPALECERDGFMRTCMGLVDATPSDSPLLRVRRRLAYLRAQEERDGRSFLAGLPSCAFRLVGNAILPRLRAAARLAPAKPCRQDLPHARIGDGLLVFNTSSGEVHILNSLSARLWLLADGTRDVAALEAEAGGRAEARRALHALQSRHILRKDDLGGRPAVRRSKPVPDQTE